MDVNSGNIERFTDAEMDDLSKFFADSEMQEREHREMVRRTNGHDTVVQNLYPLTEAEEKKLTPMNAHERKGWMRNQPCVCGSGKKFKRCCISKY